jgi:hypothetical protein
MGVLRTIGKIVGGAAKITVKATAVTVGAAYEGSKVTAGFLYDNKENISNAIGTTAKIAAKATAATADLAYKATATVAKTVYDHREEIAGAGAGLVQGASKMVTDASGHLISKDTINSKIRKIEEQSQRYRQLTNQVDAKLNPRQRRQVLLDTLVVGGQTLASYINSGRIPDAVQKAYELAYPNVAQVHSFSEQASSLDAQQLLGFVSGVKGKLFEIQYVDYLNDGHLPDGFKAALADSPTNPGWDIAINGPDGALKETIQAKATDSVSYVSDALEKYPHIDVVTTSEVHSHLVMQGFSENVIDSGISDEHITAIVEGSLDDSANTMHFVPSGVSLALIAFSAYNQEGLTAYQKSRQFGVRVSKSYFAYLAGGALSVATGTWWIGILGGMGSRLLLESGRKKRDQLAELNHIIETNNTVLICLQKRV